MEHWKTKWTALLPKNVAEILARLDDDASLLEIRLRRDAPLELVFDAVVGREVEVIGERFAEVEVDHGRRIEGRRLDYCDVIVLDNVSVDVYERVIESDVLAALVVRDHDSVVCLVCADLVFHIPYPPEKCCT